jgi:endonuclease/exonuclease/phosphatase family metal-dependent hydrolase
MSSFTLRVPPSDAHTLVSPSSAAASKASTDAMMATVLADGVEGLATTRRSPAGLRVVTWNVWFDNFEFAARFEGVMSILKELDPDVICLQEVTPRFTRLLEAYMRPIASAAASAPPRGPQENTWLTAYSFSEEDLSAGLSVAPYGVLSIARSSLAPEFSYTPFISGMGRGLMTTTIHPDATNKDISISIGNVHLESLSNHPTREMQLRKCHETLPIQSSLLVGDFNFCSYRNFVVVPGQPLENDSLDRILTSQYRDLWAILRPDKPGYTFDTESNGMLQGRPIEQMRYDRVMCAFDPAVLPWQPISIELIGTHSISKDTAPAEATTGKGVATPAEDAARKPSTGFQTPVKKKRSTFPSDHFGIVADFARIS